MRHRLLLLFILANICYPEVWAQPHRWVMNIPDSILGRDILVSTTIIKAASRQMRTNDMRYGYGGDQVYTAMIRLVRHGRCIDIEGENVPSVYECDTTNIYHSYYEAETRPLLARLEYDNGKIDLTHLAETDCELFSLRGAASDIGLGSYQPEKSELGEMKVFADNICFHSIRSYTLANPAKGENSNSRWEIVTSWMLLPTTPMKPKVFNDKVGYFTTTLAMPGQRGANDMGLNRQVAQRWRLEPSDTAAYRMGKPTDARHPITFYIDQSVPTWLTPYVRKGVEMWQEAFLQAGFTNAIQCRMLADVGGTVGDMHYPLISYKASSVPNAYGHPVVDPRSGEIVYATVNLFHSVLGLLQRWYFVQCSAIDQRGLEYPFSHELMGKLVQYVVNHEVGHTLGLRHNFVASTVFHTDSLRSPQFFRRFGQGSSVMDYQRFNYIAQPGDGFTPNDLFPRLGVYDKCAIEWGYRWGGESRKWQENNPLCKYFEESVMDDPRVQSEDAGKEPALAAEYGIRNLQRDMEFLKDWNPANDDGHFELRRRYLSVIEQYWNYLNHALRYVGSNYDGTTPVERECQESVLELLHERFFTPQNWLFQPPLMEKCGIDFETYMGSESASLEGKLLQKHGMLTNNLQRDKKGLTADDLFRYIRREAFGAEGLMMPLDRWQMRVQSNMLEQLALNAENAAHLNGEVSTKLYDVILGLKADIKKLLDTNPEPSLTKSHYQTLLHFISMWEAGSNKGLKNKD